MAEITRLESIFQEFQITVNRLIFIKEGIITQ